MVNLGFFFSIAAIGSRSLVLYFLHSEFEIVTRIVMSGLLLHHRPKVDFYFLRFLISSIFRRWLSVSLRWIAGFSHVW